MIKITILLLSVFSCLCVIDRTYYTYLGLEISAGDQDIQKAYQEKKQKIYAIQEEEARESKLKLLNQAYQTLGNAQKRNTYDRLNRDLSKKSAVLSNLNRLTNKNARKQKTMQMFLPVSTEDVYHGKTINASFLKQTACNKCKGTGAESPKALSTCSRCGGNGFTVIDVMNMYGQKQLKENNCQLCQGTGKQVTKVCPVCSGKKIISKVQNVQITIPKGLPDGNVLKFNNFGDQPLVGAPSDLQVTIVQIPSENWSRQGQNLIHTVQLSFRDAIFGFSKTITHLNGQKIPISRSEPTTKQTVINVGNKGILNQKTKKQGNLIIKFKIIMPKFTDEQLDMWQQFFRKHNL